MQLYIGSNGVTLRPVEVVSMIEEPSPLSEVYGARESDLRLGAIEGNHECRIAVIGGGVTGCATALRLAEAGDDVVLLEARTIGFGGSGRAYGLIVPIAKPGIEALQTRFGPVRSARLIDALGGGPQVVYDLIDQYGFECELERNGWILAAHSESAIPDLQARSTYWKKRDAPVDFLGSEETRSLTGSTRYQAAILDHRCGALNPLKYTRGLAAGAIGAGARVFEQSEARAIERGRKRNWRVVTSGASVEADHVIHCTNAYTGRLWPGLRQSIIPVRAYQLVTGGLPDHVFDAILPGNQVMTDTRHLFSGIRKLNGRRLHVSTGGPVSHARGGPDRREAEQRLVETFPSLRDVEWSDQWMAWVGVNAEQIPRITRLEEGMWAAMGYSGRGLAFGTVMGGELCKLMQDPARDDLVLPVEPLRKQAYHAFARLGAAAMVKWYKIADRRSA